jgi:hypothetical protein
VDARTLYILNRSLSIDSSLCVKNEIECRTEAESVDGMLQAAGTGTGTEVRAKYIRSDFTGRAFHFSGSILDFLNAVSRLG